MIIILPKLSSMRTISNTGKTADSGRQTGNRKIIKLENSEMVKIEK
jgi:hypothetical protein